MDPRKIAHVELLGRKWLAKPPEGFDYPPLSHIFQLGVLGYSIYSADFNDVLIRSHQGATDPQTIMNMEGAAVQQMFLRMNGPTFFVDPDLEATCSDPLSLKSVYCEDLKRRYMTCLYVFSPSRYVFCTMTEAGEELVFRIGKTEHVVLSPRRSFLLLCYDQDSPTVTSISRTLDTGETIYNKIMYAKCDLSLEADQEYCNKILALCCNLQLIQQSYPDYAEKIGTRCGVREVGGSLEQPKVYKLGSKARTLRPLVISKDRVSGEETGRIQRPHFRPGHWRRQPHGERFAQRNPEVQQLYFDDGRVYHMRWIDMIAINFKPVEGEEAVM